MPKPNDNQPAEASGMVAYDRPDYLRPHPSEHTHQEGKNRVRLANPGYLVWHVRHMVLPPFEMRRNGVLVGS